MNDSSRNLKLLNHEELKKIPLGEKLAVDYFYVPEIFYEDKDEGEEYWPLVFKNQGGLESDRLYASKVPAGMTLWQAVREDLEKDFNYPRDVSFRIDDVALLDTASNRYGEKLTRVLVEVVVDTRFNSNDIRPAGLTAYWQDSVKEK